jgi:hypothetical protein
MVDMFIMIVSLTIPILFIIIFGGMLVAINRALDKDKDEIDKLCCWDVDAADHLKSPPERPDYTCSSCGATSKNPTCEYCGSKK